MRYAYDELGRLETVTVVERNGSPVSDQFAGTPYRPHAEWVPSQTVTTALGQRIAFVNVGGLILYTDVYDANEDLLAVTSLALARAFYHQIGARGLAGVAARAAGLAGTRVAIDSGRLNSHVSIAGLLATVGGFAL